MSHEVKKDLLEIPIEYEGKTVIYKMRKINFDDYYAVINETQKIETGSDGEPKLQIDQSMRNKIFLSKSIVEPVMTVEIISTLPTSVGNILLTVFNKINDTDPELLKKTLATLKL